MSFAYYPLSPHVHTAVVLIGALLLDRMLGEPRKWHPLVGFGIWASRMESRLNTVNDPLASRLLGLLAWLFLLTPFIALSYLLVLSPLKFMIETGLLYFAIGARSLEQHAMAVYRALREGDLDEARNAVGRIVSRDTANSSEQEIATATVESVLENGNDAIFGAIFWWLVLGAPGVIAYRLANTLDAMWGYRTPRYRFFGWAAARLDDVLNFLPARLTAFSYAVCGNMKLALFCWRKQGKQWYSPNAGPVMAAGAGALNVTLGGAGSYHGTIKERPLLGLGSRAHKDDILRSVQLIRRSIYLWCIVAVGISALVSTYHA